MSFAASEQIFHTIHHLWNVAGALYKPKALSYYIHLGSLSMLRAALRNLAAIQTAGLTCLKPTWSSNNQSIKQLIYQQLQASKSN